MDHSPFLQLVGDHSRAVLGIHGDVHVLARKDEGGGEDIDERNEQYREGDGVPLEDFHRHL